MTTPFLRSSLPLVVSHRLSLAVAYSALTCSLSLLAPPAVAQTPAGMSLIDSAGKSLHMGDSKNELPGESWPEFEKPVRRVIFTKSFYLGQNEVTYAEWKEVLDWAQVHGYFGLANGQIGADASTGQGRPDTPDNRRHPVSNITWTNAVMWCNARSEKEGLTPCYTLLSDGSVYRTGSTAQLNCNWDASGYRLPTKDEWEYAARGGVDDGRRFPWGDEPSTHARANYRSNWDAAHTFSYDQSPTSGYHPLYNGTAPVGSFPATGFGLNDMEGNVSEWCWDWFPPNGDFSTRPDPEIDPHGDLYGTYRDYRGACFANSAVAMRCAWGDAYVPNSTGNGIGFRVARTVLTVEVSAPIFTVQPVPQSGYVGGNASFTMTASGSPAPTCLWQRKPAGSSTWSDLSEGNGYSGVATATLTVTLSSTAQSGDQFRCVATNAGGSATSDAATLTVVFSDQAFLQRLFQAVLGREIDPGALSSFGASLAGGRSRAAVVGDLFGSEEYNQRMIEPAMRLYYAALARPPEYAGLLNWVNALQARVLTLTGAADQFASSDEFLLRYGSLDNTQYVQQLYRNVLNREADPAGLADWVRQLNAGASRGTILVGFSESDEFKAKLADQVEIIRLYYLLLQQTPTTEELHNWQALLFNSDQTDSLFDLGYPSGLAAADYVQLVIRGFLRRDASADELSSFGGPLTAGTASRASVVFMMLTSSDFKHFVAPVSRLYMAAFGRVPDAGGLDNWVAYVRAGDSLQSAADAFVVSPEFHLTYGSLDDTQYVTLLYRNVLNRVPDAPGLADWVAQLSAGASRGQVLIGFSESQEEINRFAPTLQTLLHYFTFLNAPPTAADLDFWKEYPDLPALTDQLRDDLLADPSFNGS